MIRTVWLGVILFVGLLALASFKLASGSPRPVAVAEVPLSANDRELAPVVTDAAPNAAMKGDRFQIAYVAAVEPVVVVPRRPPELPATAAPRIISRHWHDPNDQKVALVTTRKPKRSKKDLPVMERKPVLEVGACKSDGLDRLNRPFNSDCRAQ